MEDYLTMEMAHHRAAGLADSQIMKYDNGIS
jgi:hypothetical protein